MAVSRAEEAGHGSAWRRRVLTAVPVAAAIGCFWVVSDQPLLLRLLWSAGLAAGAVAHRRPDIAVAAYAASLYGTPRYSSSFDTLISSNVLHLQLLFMAIGVSVGRRGRPGGPLPAAYWAGIGLFAWGVVSAIAASGSGAIIASARHSPLLFGHALVLLVVSAQVMTTWSAARVWAIALVSALAVRLQLQGVDGLRLEGDVGPLTLMVLPFGIAQLLGAQRLVVRVLWTGATVAGLGTVALTYNRASVVAFLALWFVMLWQYRRQWRWIAANAAAIVAAVSWILTTPYRDRFVHAWQELAGAATGSVTERLALWDVGLQFVRAHPLTGVGPGRYATALAGANPQLGRLVAHNSFVQVAAETGLPGLACYVALFAGALHLAHRVARRASNQADRRIAAALQASLVTYLVAGLFISRHDMGMAYILAGWCVALSRVVPSAPSGGRATDAAAAP